MKIYTLYSVPTGEQPEPFAVKWLNKVLGYQKLSYVASDYDYRFKAGVVEFRLKEVITK